jgi:uncharacterized protein YkwD
MTLNLTSALRALTLSVLAALAILATSAAPASADQGPKAQSAVTACPAAAMDPSRGNLRSLRRTTLCLLNRERSNHGLPRLRGNRRLHRSAARYSRDMVRRKFFSHVSPGGSSPTDRIKSSGYLRGAGAWAIGENLAWGGGSLASPLGTVRAWMNSPGHRANILSRNFREIGIGIALGAPARVGDAATYTTHFGRRG